MGGAMDLAASNHTRVVVTMEHTAKVSIIDNSIYHYDNSCHA